MSTQHAQREFAHLLACTILLLGCNGDADAESPLAPAQDAAGSFEAGTFPVIAPDAALPLTPADAGFPGFDAAPALDSGPGGIMLGGVDAAIPAADSGPIIINIPTRSVACGGSECTTTNNRTCCDSWSRGTGFAGAPTCTTLAACEADHPIFATDTNRAVVNECDEPGDCGGAQVCCFVRYGEPITADLFSTEVVGPGASRLCMSQSNCNAGMTTITGVLGVPIGLVACKTAADCKDGTSCMPEQANTASTGKDSAARPAVMLCR